MNDHNKTVHENATSAIHNLDFRRERRGRP